MKISGSGKRVVLTVNGVRCGVKVCAGPWVPSVDPDLVKITCKKYSFPQEVIDALSVENNTDSMTDYFERDSIRLMPGHPLYEMAKAAAA
jgi:hypothetical protein